MKLRYYDEVYNNVALIQGPLETGKMTFTVTFLQIFFIIGHSWVAYAPSNSATDHLANVFQNKCPEVGAIRFHAFDNESHAIRRQERHSALANKSGKAPGQEEDSAPPAKSESTCSDHKKKTQHLQPSLQIRTTTVTSLVTRLKVKKS